ncbi:unnamed protein product [Rotaria socialis]|uniref:AIG1-type G domain-containing protein n=2 Tax=Rotaria socialis TaxID=392032 RepID=A0A820YF31_9BILA|nr:unnamed protein product [Rotaria socialis]
MSIRDTRTAIDEDAKREEYKKKIEADFEKYGTHVMKKVNSKNIMIIGRTRSGKSTIKSMLLDPTKVPDELTLKSGTRDPNIESFYIKDMDATLNIIDTPGLFERGTDENGIRDNHAILTTIETCANMEITSFNVICFCVAITVGINGEDVKAIELFVDFLGNEISSNSCLIVTHCESKTQRQLNLIKKELEEDKFFKKIAPFFKLGIFFSGSINHDNYSNGNECILDEYVTISEYRTHLIKVFTSDIKPFPIAQTKISEVRRAKAANSTMLNDLQNAQNSCTKQKYINQDLSNKCKKQQTLIEDLQRTCKQNEYTIANEKGKCIEKERIIEECESIIEYFARNSGQHLIDSLAENYPNYVSKHNILFSQLNDHFRRKQRQKYN